MDGRYDQEGTQEDFTGHVKDTETGLHYAGARYYSAAFARWTTTDPILGQKGPKVLLGRDQRLLSMSPYNYAFDSPVLLRDPNGRFPILGTAVYVGGATLTGAAGGALTSASFQLLEKGSVDFDKVGTAAVKGGAAGLGVATGGILGAAIAGAGAEGLEAYAKGESLEKGFTDAVIGAAGSAAGAYLGQRASRELAGRLAKQSDDLIQRLNTIDEAAGTGNALSLIINTRPGKKFGREALSKVLGASTVESLVGNSGEKSSKVNMREIIEMSVKSGESQMPIRGDNSSCPPPFERCN